jgi:hypothetical protein
MGALKIPLPPLKEVKLRYMKVSLPFLNLASTIFTLPIRAQVCRYDLRVLLDGPGGRWPALFAFHKGVEKVLGELLPAIEKQ